MISVEWPKDSAPSFETWLKIAENFEAALAAKDTEKAELEKAYIAEVSRRRAAEAALSEMRAELERHQDEEDKAAREMQSVIQRLRDRATAAEAQLERVKKALEIGRQLANAAFNIHQRGAVDARSLQTLKEVQTAWDEALLSPARALSQDEPADLGVGG